MKDLNQVERIKIKLNLAKNTDSFLEVFGARSHRYRLDSPIDIKEVEIFEKKYNISLPDEYKVFLTQIGNGGNEYKTQVGNSGAGPYYGIYKLGDEGHTYVTNPALGYIEKEPFFNSKMTKEDWKKIDENMPEDISSDEYEREYAKAYAGILTICACGCIGYMGIMLSGENTGRVVCIYDEIGYCPEFVKEANFLDWYENWLDLIISGQSIIIPDKAKIKDLFIRYEEDNEPYWKLVTLGYIRGHCSLPKKYLKILWENYHIEKDKTVKLYILNLLVKFDYKQTEEELEKLSKTNPLEFLKILHLYAEEKTFEWQNIIQKLQNETINLEVTEYVQYVTMKDFSKTRE